MSIKLMTLVWDTDLPLAAMVVLLSLADNANDQGECYPSIPVIAKRAKLSVRSVFRVLDRLEEDDHLTRQQRPGRSTLYLVHPRVGPIPKPLDLPLSPPLTGCHPCQPVTPDTVAGTPDTVSPPPLTQCQVTPDTVSPIIIRESSIESSLNRQGAPDRVRRAAVTGGRQKRLAVNTRRDEPPPSNLNVEAWHRWVQYRVDIRKPLKQASMPAAQRQLAAYGPDQAAVVEQSIANGYMGLFELKRSGGEKPAGAPATASEAEKLAALQGRRQGMGIPKFRDPSPGETADGYWAAMCAATPSRFAPKAGHP